MARPNDPVGMAARYTGLALILPAATLAGYFIGYLLDGAFGTSFLRIVFLVLGVAAGFISLFRELERQARRDGN